MMLMNTTTRYIAKCKSCNCVTSALATAEEMRAVQMYDGFPKTQVMPASPFYYVNGSLVLDCRTCRKPKYAHAVRGKFSAKHVCNAKCLSSTGTVCECSCAGKNHGASYAA